MLCLFIAVVQCCASEMCRLLEGVNVAEIANLRVWGPLAPGSEARSNLQVPLTPTHRTVVVGIPDFAEQLLVSPINIYQS